MTDRREREPFHARRSYRLITGSLGLLLIGVGLYALFFSGASAILRLVAGAALVLPGYDMVASAFKARESWLSRLGPLP